MKTELDEKGVYHQIKKEEIDRYILERNDLIQKVMTGETGLKDFLGWFRVEENTEEDLMKEISEIAKEIRLQGDALVVVGVGGSNRGAQSIIEGLHLNRKGAKVKVYYAGNNLSGSELLSLFRELDNKSVYLNVIAKDFNTLEPGIVFRMFRDYFKERNIQDIKNRIIVTGSCGKGQLEELASQEGYRFLHFPKRVGGRFSVFTAVGLLPMAVAGADIRKLVNSAIYCEQIIKETPYLDNIAVRYSVIRQLLSVKGFKIENLAYFEPSLQWYGEWWLQLHGESEGKCDEAILPMLTSFSEDLHAIGQFLQEGPRFIFETFLNMMIKSPLVIKKSDIDDGFSYLDDKKYQCLNEAVYRATKKAHTEDGIPVIEFRADTLDEEVLGELMYINMISTYLSSVFLGVEPFNQNGVENYKKNLYDELGKYRS